MKKLIIVRHGESIWNLENRFTGWTDVGLSEKGIEIPVNLKDFASLRDARTDEIYPLSLESVKAIGYACKYGTEGYNDKLFSCLTEFARLEEIRFQVREMPCDINDWFD